MLALAARALGVGDRTLTETSSTPSVTVHFTTTAGPNQTTRAIADAVAREMDGALHFLFRRYRPAIPASNNGKLNVDIKDLGSANGRTDAMAIVGDARLAASYINITSDLVARAAASGLTLEEFIRVVCMHECMHAVQNSYNAHVSPWFREAQAAWAEAAFTGISGQLAGYYAAGDSVSLNPGLPLWAATPGEAHERSLSAFVHFLVSKKGMRIVDRWLAATEGTNDAMAALQTALGGDGRTFSGLYRQFLLQLYRRDIRFTPIAGGRANLVLPPIAELPALSELGQDFDLTLTPTGAAFARFTPDVRIPNTYAIAMVEDGATGAPELLVIKRPQRTSPIRTIKPADHTVINGFNSSVETLVIFTDTTVRDETVPPTPIKAKLLSPYLHFKTVQPETPIAAGQISTIDITYDLLGLPPGVTSMRVDFRIAGRGPGVAVRTTQEIDAFTGADRHLFPIFQSAADRAGSYRFTWTGLTPMRGFSARKLPQSRTSISNHVVVDEAPAP